MRACLCAAKYGHLEVLQFLRLQQSPPCPWDPRACLRAARSGPTQPSLELLRWLGGEFRQAEERLTALLDSL